MNSTKLNDYFAREITELNNALKKRALSTSVSLIHNISLDLLLAKGKRLRPLLCYTAAVLVGKKVTKVCQNFALAVELIHGATLLHDDVVDESIIRHGKPSAMQRFGNKAAILVGDYLFSESFNAMTETNNIAALKVLSNAAKTISAGEVQQLENQGNLDLNLHTYINIMAAKTATLFAASTEMGALSSNESLPVDEQKKWQKFGFHIGLAYQILDDIWDYTRSDRGKQQGDDFYEGKVTLPIILSIEENKKLKEYWQNQFSLPLKAKQNNISQVIENLKSSGAITSSYELAKKHLISAFKIVEELNPHHALRLVMEETFSALWQQ